MNKSIKKAGEMSEQLRLHISYLQKIPTRAVFLVASAANKLGTSRFLIGCMIWQHPVNLESIWETNWIMILLHAERTGLITPLLTCSPLLFFCLLIGQSILSPTSPSSFFCRTNYSKSNFSF